MRSYGRRHPAALFKSRFGTSWNTNLVSQSWPGKIDWSFTAWDIRARSTNSKSFCKTCLNIANLLQSSGIEIPEEVVNKKMTRKKALVSFQNSGLIGKFLQREIRRTVIEPQEVAAFLALPVPRTVPRQLVNQVKGDWFLYLFGGILVLIGFIVMLVGQLGQPSETAKIGLLTGAAIAFLSGGTTVYLVKRFEQGRMRLLTHGRVREAKIESVTESPYTSGNRRVYHARVRMIDEQDQPPITVSILGVPVQAAVDVAESGKSTRVLQDIHNKQKIMLVECHALQ